MSVGLDWYKREPIAYLGDTQGLTSKQHAVYGVVVELLYVHGGEIQNDPKWISGWISDMGASAVRTALAQLDENPRITIAISETSISQKRAKTEAKLKRNQSETASISGQKGGKKSAELRAASIENNDLTQADPSTEIQAEKRREENIEKTTTNVVSKKTGKRLSEDWILPKDWGQWAVDQGWNESAIRLEAEKFKDFWISKAGKDAAKRDWLATWRNWMRNSKTPKGTINGKSSGADIAQRAADRWAARGMDSGEGASSSQPLLSAGQPAGRSGSSD